MLSFFFFSSRRRHTRCGRDWSSDVCSSDLSPNQLVWRCRTIQRCGGLPWRGWHLPIDTTGSPRPICFESLCSRCLRICSRFRSEERRVGKEGRSRWAPYHLKKKKKENEERT